MKRLRDESYTGSQFKRPFGTSRGELYGQSQSTMGIGSGSGGQKLTTDDALQYLKEVKELFQDQPEKYNQFLEVMKDFKAQRIDTEGVIARVKELFKGHNRLIYGFNTFLPKGYEITLDEIEPPPKKVVEFDEAITFVNKIKRRFQDDDQVYKSFLDILNMYRKENKNISEVYDEVSQLFEDHSDLIEEFTRFLPDNSSSATIHHSSQNARSNSRPLLMNKGPRSRDRVGTAHGEHGQHLELDGDTEMMRSHKDQRKHDKENRNRKNHDGDDREIERLYDKRKAPVKVESSDTKNDVKSMYHLEYIFCEKIKEKLGQYNYQAFLKCLHIYSREIITRTELQGLIVDLLGKFPDLMEGFSEFLERCENIYGFLACVMKNKSLLSDEPLPRPMKKDDKDKGPKRETDTAKEKANKEYSSKSIQELDLSNCERCTPSYRLLPDDYLRPTGSQRSNIGARVLNDYWVSVTSGSEDFSFTHMRRNQYEESLFRCEDDRYELDMLLESVTSTANKVEDLLNNINDRSIGTDAPIRVDDYFTPLNLRCIERIYGDHGLDVLDILHKNSAIALPVILTRLKQKLEEWTKCRADFNKVWAETYAKNHYKSLDHRSFYFKQQDSKNLSTKSLVAEIKEIKDRMQEEDDMLLAITAGIKRLLVPHLKFEYSDNNIHEDLYKLVKFSCEEVLSTKEQLNKVTRLWTTFLEPMLGVTSLSRDDDSTEDVEARRQPVSADMAAEKSRGDVPRCSKTNGDIIEKEQELNSRGKEKSTADAQSKSLTDADVADRVLDRLHSSTENAQEPESVTGAVQLHSAAADTLAGMTNANQHLEKTVGQSENDKEEGELSPNGDVDVENSTSSGNGNKHSTENQQYQDSIVEGGGQENDARAENEGSENPSEGGDGVSGSESAGNECSGDEHEHDEEEDAEHDKLEEGKGESEEVHSLGGDVVGSLKLSERFLLAKPLAKYVSLVSQDMAEDNFRVFYGNDNFYVLFRLHRMLYERLLVAKTSSKCSESKWKNSKDPNDLDPYGRFKAVLFNLVDGSSDNAKFEDDCRAILGNQSYVLFTLDKLIYKLVKQLRAIVTDEMDTKLLQLYEYEKSRKSEKFVDSVYHDNARVLLPEDNIYRLEFASFPDRMSIQLTDTGNEKPEMVTMSLDPVFAGYLNNDFLAVVSSKKEPQGIILQRNKRTYAGLDEHSASSKAMEGIHLSNGLECKVACSSSKISYVLDTEDLLFRTKRGRKSLPADRSVRLNQSRIQRFHKFLSVACR